MAITLGSGPNPKRLGFFRNNAVTVAARADVSLGIIHVNGATRLGMRVENEHVSVAFDQFTTQFKFHPRGDWVTVASVDGHYKDPVYPVLKETEDLITLAAGGVKWVVLNVEGVFAVRFLCSGNAAATTASIEGTLA